MNFLLISLIVIILGIIGGLVYIYFKKPKWFKKIAIIGASGILIGSVVILTQDGEPPAALNSSPFPANGAIDVLTGIGNISVIVDSDSTWNISIRDNSTGTLLAWETGVSSASVDQYCDVSDALYFRFNEDFYWWVNSTDGGEVWDNDSYWFTTFNGSGFLYLDNITVDGDINISGGVAYHDNYAYAMDDTVAGTIKLVKYLIRNNTLTQVDSVNVVTTGGVSGIDSAQAYGIQCSELGVYVIYEYHVTEPIPTQYTSTAVYNLSTLDYIDKVSGPSALASVHDMTVLTNNTKDRLIIAGGGYFDLYCYSFDGADLVLENSDSTELFKVSGFGQYIVGIDNSDDLLLFSYNLTSSYDFYLEDTYTGAYNDIATDTHYFYGVSDTSLDIFSVNDTYDFTNDAPEYSYVDSGMSIASISDKSFIGSSDGNILSYLFEGGEFIEEQTEEMINNSGNIYMMDGYESYLIIAGEEGGLHLYGYELLRVAPPVIDLIYAGNPGKDAVTRDGTIRYVNRSYNNETFCNVTANITVPDYRTLGRYFTSTDDNLFVLTGNLTDDDTSYTNEHNHTLVACKYECTYTGNYNQISAYIVAFGQFTPWVAYAIYTDSSNAPGTLLAYTERDWPGNDMFTDAQRESGSMYYPVSNRMWYTLDIAYDADGLPITSITLTQGTSYWIVMATNDTAGYGTYYTSFTTTGGDWTDASSANDVSTSTFAYIDDTTSYLYLNKTSVNKYGKIRIWSNYSNGADADLTIEINQSGTWVGFYDGTITNGQYVDIWWYPAYTEGTSITYSKIRIKANVADATHLVRIFDVDICYTYGEDVYSLLSNDLGDTCYIKTAPYNISSDMNFSNVTSPTWATAKGLNGEVVHYGCIHAIANSTYNTNIQTVSIASAILHWYNSSVNLWNLTMTEIGSTGNWTKNVTGLTSGTWYTFDIIALDDLNDEVLYEHYRTIVEGTTERIQFQCGVIDSDEASHQGYNSTSTLYRNESVLYLVNRTYGDGTWYGDDEHMEDALPHEQGVDGTTEDTGGWESTFPDDTIQARHCVKFAGSWWEDNITIENSLVLNNVYAHLWTCGGYPNQYDKMRLHWGQLDTLYDFGWLTKIGELAGERWNYLELDLSSDTIESAVISNIPEKVNDPSGVFNTSRLVCKYINITDTIDDSSFDSGSIYNFFLGYDNNGTLDMYNENAMIINNKSYLSFIIFNIPQDIYDGTDTTTDSDSDGLSDYYEMNLSFTHPFLVDTDGDGTNDNLDGAPNDYTSLGKSATIRRDGVDYFIWLGSNGTVSTTVVTKLTGFDETTEYVAQWNTSATWGSDGIWVKYYYGGAGTNFYVKTFDILKVYLTDSGTESVVMIDNPDINYATERTLTLTIGINQGANYVGWTDNAATTASAIATAATLENNEQVWWWNEVTYAWEYYIVGFSEPAITISEDDVLVIRVADQETLSIGGK